MIWLVRCSHLLAGQIVGLRLLVAEMTFGKQNQYNHPEQHSQAGLNLGPERPMGVLGDQVIFLI